MRPEPDPDKEYPPDPQWGFDQRGYWWRYMDYDGESLEVRVNDDNTVWVDKHGEGAVFIKAEHVPLIIKALTDKDMYKRRRRRAETSNTNGLELQ
jgi:hypothetical protein